MTLRRLSVEGAPERIVRRPPDSIQTAIAFAFDAEYAQAFSVMAYSMARSGTLLDAPIYIYSNDKRVFDDPLVRHIADKQILIEGDALLQLEQIAEHHIQRAERAKWNRGTCLKWAVFDEAQVDQILFLDVDMLCLRPLEGLLTLKPSAALVCCPQFQRSMLPASQEQDSKLVTKQRLTELVDRRSQFMGRINSGVMLIRKPLLNRQFRNSLIAFAKSRNDINEQSHLTNFFRDARIKRQFPISMASSSYNFQENYLLHVDPIDALQLIRRVRILHYAGSQKPWAGKGQKQGRMTMQLWRNFHAAAKDNSDLQYP